jgi:hypothetical protein
MVEYTLGNAYLVSPFYDDATGRIGHSQDKKVWNICINTSIGDAYAPSCSLLCLAIPCKEVAHVGQVGVVIGQPLGATPVRRVGSDLVFYAYGTGSCGKKDEIIRLKGEYLYMSSGKEMGFSMAGPNQRREQDMTHEQISDTTDKKSAGNRSDQVLDPRNRAGSNSANTHKSSRWASVEQ